VSASPPQQPFDLARFEAAQDAQEAYARAVSELQAGRKRSHWMWFVFPQISGLGASEMSRRYAIASLREAQAYLHHPLLGDRLTECTEILLGLSGLSALEILGPTDAVKLRSCMTLFTCAAPGDPLFTQALEHYFDGAMDPATIARVAALERSGDR
jgi:uncharacterized protein (DUF1810 family)